MPLLGLIMCFVAGCTGSDPQAEPASGGGEVRVSFTADPVRIDGRLDDRVWQDTPTYRLKLSWDKQKKGVALAEQGCIQVAHDSENLYVAIRFDDDDVIAMGDRDQLHHYQLGDVAEVFLKPANAPWYWEMYVTPRSHKTVFFFRTDDAFKSSDSFKTHDVDLHVAAQVQGTLNHSHDRDTGWTGEMAISKEKLSDIGVSLDIDQPWTIFVGRYNHGRSLAGQELSMYPALSATNYHLTDEYAPLLLLSSS